ncbi:DUF6314 family protein [Rhodococcus sp. IEGM 1379]|uniref:DUF6314 family protein n=1 Tax=Rhodococcus sp. IEGM 1379 TaxID=3047086 RepID=UPI0024B6BD52|nr:DUF6314 family protein [Rhodococcus sp. IEGM 1379]MDI9916381.1 DUF6314 family protein [Rhodococcus sp. IEGM 1379]
MVNNARVDPKALVGEWNFERTIVDRIGGSTKRVVGQTAIEEKIDGRLRWYESGTLFDGDLELAVFRTLFIEQQDGNWAVTFEDGREFHEWNPGQDVEHLCGADTYRGRVDIEAATEGWSVEWTVSGPSKDYTMTTYLTRH